MAPPRRHTLKMSFKKQASADSYTDPFETDPDLSTSVKGDLSASAGPTAGGRHWTISGLKTKFSFRKSQSFSAPMRENRDNGLSLRDNALSPRRRDRSITGSIFYDDENMAVTKNVSEPAEFDSLDLRGKSMNELLVLIKPVSIFHVFLFCSSL